MVDVGVDSADRQIELPKEVLIGARFRPCTVDGKLRTTLGRCPATVVGAPVLGYSPDDSGAGQGAKAWEATSNVTVVGPLVSMLYVAAVLGVSAVSVVTALFMLYAWRDPAAADSQGFPGTTDEPRLSFSLIVPARHEEAVLGPTLAGLCALTHPDYEVIVVIGHDDPGTLAVADEWAGRRPDLIRIVIDHNWPKTKPKALNSALPFCRGEVIGVFDAEDDVHPAVLNRVDSYLSQSGADICQAGVQLTNYHDNWWALRNCLEYFFHFASRVHLYSRLGVLPLGGNTLFVRTGLVLAEGGWDPDCLTEDCELGVRLTSHGASTVVAYVAHLATREQTPPTAGALVRQRTRWDQGFLQVYKKRDWLGLRTRRQRLFIRFILAGPLFQAAAAVLVPFSLVTLFWTPLPLALSLVTFLLPASALLLLAVEIAGFRVFCRAIDDRARPADYVRLVLGAPIYQVLLAVAAVHAISRERRGIRNWVKTEHSGARRSEESLNHRDASPAPIIGRSMPPGEPDPRCDSRVG